MFPPPKRKGRPLLAAAAGIAFVSFAACRQQRPVGNLRGPDTVPSVEQPPTVAVQPGSAGSGTTGTDTSPPSVGGGPLIAPEPIAPVGNLRLPPQEDPDSKPAAPVTPPKHEPKPVGNLRPPE